MGKQCAKRLDDFRSQVLVDDLEETMNNDWRQRIKQEKAKTLEEIHRDWAEKNRAQNQQSHRPYNNNQHHGQYQRNGGGGGGGKNSRSSYDNTGYNGYGGGNGGRSNNQFKRVTPSSNYQRVKLRPQRMVEEVDPMDRIMKLVRECLIGGKCDALITFLQKDGNAATYKGRWGEIINSVFINRSRSEVDQFMSFLIKLMDSECIAVGNDFVSQNVKFLALNCDDSAGDCPNFCQYLGTLMGKLLGRNLVPLSVIQKVHDFYVKEPEADSDYGTPIQTKIGRFSKIVLSIMKCLSEAQNDNVLQDVASHIAQRIERSHVDREVFDKKGGLQMYNIIFAE